MWYLAECSVPALGIEEFGRISEGADRAFGDGGYHLLGDFRRGRLLGLFRAERADVVEQWLFRHGATVERFSTFEADAEHGRVFVAD
jgi:hypothetical protein